MSSEVATPMVDRKSKNHRNGSEKKSSKKRKHEEPSSTPQPAEQEQSPVKKQKKHKKDKRENREKEQFKATKTQSESDLAARRSPEQESNPALNVEAPSQQVTSTTTQAMNNGELEQHSPFVQKTASLYLALSPIAHNFPLEGICAEHVSPLLLSYFPPLKGVLLSYLNPRLSEHPTQGVAMVTNTASKKTVLSRSIDEYAVTYIWLTAEFLLFRPAKDTVLEGYVNLQNEGILGLMCYNYFNAGIERNRLPADWKWVSNEGESLEGTRRKGRANAPGDGYFVNGTGQKVDGKIVFRVRDFVAGSQSESGIGTINILGTLLGAADDYRVDAEDEERAKAKAKSREIL